MLSSNLSMPQLGAMKWKFSTEYFQLKFSSSGVVPRHYFRFVHRNCIKFSDSSTACAAMKSQRSRSSRGSQQKQHC